MPARFVILGAAGDLTSRYLLPAVASLAERSSLPIAPVILGVSQNDWDTDHFRRHIAERFERHGIRASPQACEDVINRLEYRQADATDPDDLRQIIGDQPEPLALYLALPPKVAGKVLRSLAELKLPEESRIVCEKPFGHDHASARELNALLRPLFPERSIFRIDHFLGKQTVQNVLGLRFANRVFEYLWNREHIERVEITWDETVALEGRAGYYDTAGALRDMVQNHLLQLLCLVAMEAPVNFTERDFRDRKVEVLRAVRRFTPEEVRRHTRRARYTTGRVGDQEIPNYVDEPDVKPERQTETFAQTTLFVDNWRWSGVPFVLRTGKALAANRQQMLIHFRPVPHLAFERSKPTPNCLALRLNPDRLDLSVNINGPGDPFVLETTDLGTELRPQELSAYARLLLDLFEGNAVLSIRGDEAEESWAIMEPILAGWSEGACPMEDYAAGSEGPA